MQILRAVPITVPADPDVFATVRAFQKVQQSVSLRAFEHVTQTVAGTADGRVVDAGQVPAPLSAITLHHACYADVKGRVSAQMTATAIRVVAGAYASARRKGHVPHRPFAFRRPVTTWLIGERGRDASLPDDGSLSLWTVAGRKRLPFSVPEYFRGLLGRATVINSLTITAHPADLDPADPADVDPAHPAGRRPPRLRASLTVTLEAPDPAGHSPVGIDRGAVNALVAVDAQDRVLFLSGREHQARNERTRRVRRRVRAKRAARKAQKKDTRSVRRLLERLSRKQRDRTRAFTGQAAKALCDWAPPGAVFVLEALRLPAARPARRDQATGRLSAWSHGLLGRCIGDKAQERGIPVATAHPAFTSRRCSRCGLTGTRRGHRFTCPTCGHAEHADVNAARNIRDAGNTRDAERNTRDAAPGPR